MQEREFDKFAEEYRRLHAANIRASGETPEYFANKVREVVRALLARGEHPRRILDFGAGVGTSVPYFRDYIPDASLGPASICRKNAWMSAGRVSRALWNSGASTEG